jgi:hypothetical protein
MEPERGQFPMPEPGPRVLIFIRNGLQARTSALDLSLSRQLSCFNDLVYELASRPLNQAAEEMKRGILGGPSTIECQVLADNVGKELSDGSGSRAKMFSGIDEPTTTVDSRSTPAGHCS